MGGASGAVQAGDDASGALIDPAAAAIVANVRSVVVVEVEYLERLLGVIASTRSALENAEASLQELLIEQRPPLHLAPQRPDETPLLAVEPRRFGAL